jgi:hypothetical protein
MQLRLTGVVKEQRPSDSPPDYDYENVMMIGEQDVIECINKLFWAHLKRPMMVVLNGEKLLGMMSAWRGLPDDVDDYSWVEGRSPELTIGDINLYERLRAMDGQTVTLWIADEPFNTLDPPPVLGGRPATATAEQEPSRE